ncbi:hypothetical protein QJS83_05905 [Bdellovibrio sp. 22V]|uniref:hypothetical protein n=1 Tax=Bdellovibrio sp. 22V TaxID=3044166 RepID=UPI002542A482|nr:hypothetical protein [Bdellovibrio sp. 22V]WII73402.1 hypothetical protein QJS83_05905 [Bdellovibrio sp. 22V]
MNFMRQAYWIDPQPETRTLPVPVGKVDLVTVFAHELGHGLGFNGFLERSTGAVPAHNGISVFDSLMYETNLSGSPVFTGAKTLTAYGSKLPVTFFTFPDSRTNTYSIAGVNYIATLHPSQNLTHYGRYTASNESAKSLQGLMGGAWLFRADQGLRIRVSNLDAAVLCDMGVPCR